jgi:3-methyladenine DNA glycosylase AlkD
VKIRSTIAAIEESLQAAGTADRAAGEKRYLKSDLDFLGATVPQVRRQALIWLRAYPDLELDQLRRLVQALWRRRVHELRSFGIELLVGRVDLLTAGDLQLVEWILNRANTWAHVDPVAVQIAGPLVERHPHLAGALDRWASDDNFWLRRSALLAHLLPLRHGAGDWDRFVRYAGQMLEEKEFFVRKAIGWVLREAAKKTPQRVVEFLSVNLHRISGLSLREAIKPLSPDDRDRLLAAYQDR